jgi:hypothetical protein
MPYSTRTVGFHCELLHPPIPVDVAAVQRVHNRLFESPDPLYKSFSVNHDGCQLSNLTARPGAVSHAAFLVDRFRFSEEGTGLSTEEFAARVVAVAEQVAEARGLPIFVGQIVTLRTLVNPRTFSTALEFLRSGVLRVADDQTGLGRPVGGLGVRLVFPPTQTEPYTFNVRVETLPHDRRSLFLENQATFPPLAVQNGLALVTRHIEKTYAFLTGPLLDLVERLERGENGAPEHDGRGPSEGGGE